MRVLTADVAWSPADVCFFGGTAFAHIVFNYATFISLGLSPVVLVLAVLMIAMQSLIIFKAMVPYSKQWLGEHWRLVIVPLMLSSELGSAFLLTRLTAIGDIEFWGALCIQDPGAQLSLQSSKISGGTSWSSRQFEYTSVGRLMRRRGRCRRRDAPPSPHVETSLRSFRRFSWPR